MTQGHFSAVTSLAVCEDGWTLLSGSRDRTVHVWDLRTPDAEASATIPIHEAVEGEQSAGRGRADHGAFSINLRLVTFEVHTDSLCQSFLCQQLVHPSNTDRGTICN